MKIDFSDLDPKKTLVLVVDLQNDFCHEKSVLKRKRKRNSACASRVYKFIEDAEKRGVMVAFTRQIFDKSKLTKQQEKYYSELISGKRKTFGAYSGKIRIPCKKDSFGAEYFNYNPPKDRLFIKNNFDIWQNKKFVKFLADHKIETLIVTGVEIVCCILYAVLGAEERGFKTVIPRDLVSGVNGFSLQEKGLVVIPQPLQPPVVN